MESLNIKIGKWCWEIVIELILQEYDGNVIDAMNYATLACLLKYKHKSVKVENNVPVIEDDQSKLSSSFNLNHLPIVMSFGIYNEKSGANESSENDYVICDPTVS